jgi:hypothetical protein
MKIQLHVHVHVHHGRPSPLLSSLMHVCSMPEVSDADLDSELAGLEEAWAEEDAAAAPAYMEPGETPGRVPPCPYLYLVGWGMHPGAPLWGA